MLFYITPLASVSEIINPVSADNFLIIKKTRFMRTLIFKRVYWIITYISQMYIYNINRSMFQGKPRKKFSVLDIKTLKMKGLKKE